MAQPEGGDRPSPHERGSSQAVLMTAVLRHNALMQRRYGPESTTGQVVVGDNTDFRLSTFPDRLNRRLRIAIIEPTEDTPPSGDVTTTTQGLARFIDVATYDAGRGEFAPFPELLRADEFAVVAEEAIEARRRGLERSEYDFDHPDIRALHRKHRKVLEEDDMISRLVETHNSEDLARGRDVHIDEATSYHVSLRSELSDPSTDAPVMDDGSIYEMEEALLVVELVGDYTVEEGTPVRRRSNHLVIGIRDEDSVDERYTPIEAGRTLSPEEFGKIVGLANELKLAKMVTHPNLDTEVVALRRS